MGQGRINYIEELPEAEFKCVSDIDKEVTEEIFEKYELSGFADYNDLFESNLIDAVL